MLRMELKLVLSAYLNSIIYRNERVAGKIIVNCPNDRRTSSNETPELRGEV
jgi:hypothetical protein